MYIYNNIFFDSHFFLIYLDYMSTLFIDSFICYLKYKVNLF